ncbi:MAG TPA: phytanoyl-CoA dioxygenase family protein [Fimbriimonas sp.]|nr:phytanoyl-CoA dioxygenase family protein [Fimbriimonas sp.]
MREQGLCVLENVFSRQEMDDLAEAIERYQRKHQEALRASGGAQGISRAEEITFTDHIAEQDPTIMEFCKRPEMVEIATTFLGPDIDLYWNQSVYKMPEGDKQFPWHQDDGYTPVDPSPYLTCWLALNDATPENGCISALPGSHKDGLKPHVWTDLGLSCHSTDDPDQGVLVPVTAGSMAVFWSLTAHKSGSNRSKGTRKAYIIQYSNEGLKRVEDGGLIEGLEPIARDGRRV